MQAESIISLVMIVHLRKQLNISGQNLGLKPVFNSFLVLNVFIIIIDSIFVSEPYTQWIIFGLIGFMINLAAKYSIFKNSRMLIFSVIPFLVLRIFGILFKWIDSDLYDKYSTYIVTGISFCIIWIIAMLFIYSRQKKAREKEEVLRKIEEEQKRSLELRKQQLETLVNERTIEITKQKEELLLTLSELKATQTQLVHHEKMASLGELTAGIAHEIQNPLNFVNNFSEVSIELLDEMQEEINNNNLEDVKAIVNDIKQNLSKIAQHGKRADSIVKGMLQHSRSSTGEKIPSNINAIADEYLRLSYHGLRAKDKGFNASMEVNLDQSIEDVNIIPQDMGRVLLNLFNNAFYSVTEKKQTSSPDYQPTVYLSSKRVGDFVEIKIRDNGLGIPQKALEKIYQPFFTTKPTGQGTGLGLSMSYDIVTKGHGGKLIVDTKENEYAEFTILLPI